MHGWLGGVPVLVAAGLLAASMGLAPVQAGEPDDHVQLDGTFDGGNGGGGRTIVSVDAVNGTWTAEMTSTDGYWLLHSTLAPHGLVFQLEGSWGDGFHGEALGFSLCSWRLDIGPYGDGEEIRVFVYSAGPISACWYWWWGDFSDAELL